MDTRFRDAGSLTTQAHVFTEIMRRSIYRSCWRPVGVIRSRCWQMPQQSWSVGSPVQVAWAALAGGVGPGRPRANHAPTWKHELYGLDVSSYSAEKSR